MSGKLVGAVLKSRLNATRTFKFIYVRIADACDDAGRPLKHLTIAEIAEDIGCHHSTVSRAIEFGRKTLGILEPNENGKIGGVSPVRSINVDRLIALIPEKYRPKDLSFHPLNKKSRVTETEELPQASSTNTASPREASRNETEHNKEQYTKNKAARPRNRQRAIRTRASAADDEINVSAIDRLMDYLVTGADEVEVTSKFAKSNFAPGIAEKSIASYIRHAFAENTSFLGNTGKRVERLLSAFNGRDGAACRNRCESFLMSLSRSTID